MFRFLLDSFLIVALMTILSSMAVGAEKELTYDEMIKKEEIAREKEDRIAEEMAEDNYEASLEEEEKERELEESNLDKEVEADRTEYIEVSDDAGYTKGNESKERVRGDKEWNKLHDGFDKPNK